MIKLWIISGNKFKHDYLRNEFNNLEYSLNQKYFRQETRSIHDSMNIPKIELLLIFTIYYKYLKYKNCF